MAHIIATLESPKSQQYALAIIDTDKGVSYLQSDQLSPLHQLQDLRGIALANSHLYVVTACSLQIYQLETTSPFFRLQNEVVLPEWILGKKSQANLYPVAISLKRQRVYVGNNHLASIDELSLEGDLIKRRHLWDIAPGSFYTPEKATPEYQYGHIRNIHEAPSGSIYLTIAFCRQTDNGIIVDLDTGFNLLSGLNHPWGGIMSGEFLYLVDSKKGKLFSYQLDLISNRCNPTPCWTTSPSLSNTTRNNSALNLRGLVQHENILYCGVCDFFSPLEEQFPPYIAGFDKKTGRQVQKISMPDLTTLRQPRVYFLLSLPDDLTISSNLDLTYFLHGKKIDPQYYKKIQLQRNRMIRPLYCLSQFSIARKNIIKPMYCPAPLPKKRIPSIIIDKASLCYRRSANFFLSKNKRLRERREYWALRDFSLTIYEGDTIGLIGRNGSGKSTTSMMISGALKPDKGKVTTHGKVQLLALGIGFRPQLTGRENVLISGTILGMPRKEIKVRMGEIQEFAELGDFFDEPIRTYSAGMKSRLGFAVSTAVQPDILILDEVMSTGDAAFRHKANKRMEEMRERTQTVIIVSHSPALIKELCSRVVWLEQGRLLMDGSTGKILPIYERFCKNPDDWLADHPEAADLVTKL